MSEEFPGTAELLLNSVPAPCIRPLASSLWRISRLYLIVSKVSGSDGFKPCHFEGEETEGYKQECALGC